MRLKFRLNNLCEDFLIPILKKFEYPNGVRLYRASKRIKGFVDQKRIVWFWPRAILYFEGENYKIPWKIKRQIGLLRWDDSDEVSFGGRRINITEPLLLIPRVTTLRIDGSLFMQVVERYNLMERLKTELQALRGIYQLALGSSFASVQMAMIIDLVKPKILCADFQCYDPRLVFFKKEEQNWKETRLRMNGISHLLTLDFFEHCRQRKAVDLFLLMVKLKDVPRLIIKKWTSCVDVGQLDEIRMIFTGKHANDQRRISFEDFQELLLQTLFTDEKRKKKQFGYSQNPNRGAFRSLRRRTTFGKDRILVQWSETSVFNVIISFYDKP